MVFSGSQTETPLHSRTRHLKSRFKNKSSVCLSLDIGKYSVMTMKIDSQTSLVHGHKCNNSIMIPKFNLLFQMIAARFVHSMYTSHHLEQPE